MHLFVMIINLRQVMMTNVCIEYSYIKVFLPDIFRREGANFSLKLFYGREVMTVIQILSIKIPFWVFLKKVFS